jgi:hypothetical protein
MSRWANNRYEGNFVNGIYHGIGTFIWEDNSMYKGNWKDGKRHGSGIYTSGDGLYTYDGDWQSDLKHGQGFQQLLDGRTFEGTFIDGLAGPGVLTLRGDMAVLRMEAWLVPHRSSRLCVRRCELKQYARVFCRCI